MAADSGAESNVSRLCISIEEILSQTDHNLPQVKQVVQSLSELLKERKKLESVLKKPVNSRSQEMLQECNERRLQEIGGLVSMLQAEFHELTKSTDQHSEPERHFKAAKPRRRQKNRVNEAAVSLDTARRLLISARVGKSDVIISLGSVDSSLALAAMCFFGAHVALFSGSSNERKVAQGRIVLCLEHFKHKFQDCVIDHLAPLMIEPLTLFARQNILANIRCSLYELPHSKITESEETYILEAINRFALSSQKKQRLLIAKEISGVFLSALSNDIFPLVGQNLQTISASFERELRSLEQQKRLILILSERLLWDIYMRDSHSVLRGILDSFVSANPSRIQLLVLNRLEVSDYAGDVWKYIPWSMDSRGYCVEYDTYRDDLKDSLISYQDSLCWFYFLLRRGNNQEERNLLENYKPCVRHYYVLYPTARAPIFPFHYSLAAFHCISAIQEDLEEHENSQQWLTDASQAVSRTWMFSARQEINSSEKASGTHVFALWDMEHQSTFRTFPGIVHRKRKLWEDLLLQEVRKCERMDQIVAWLIQELSDSGSLSELLLYEGFFVISDHPGRCVILSTPSYMDNIRFYTAEKDFCLAGASHERPSAEQTLLFGEGEEWVTYRMGIPQKTTLYSNGKIVHRSLSLTSANGGEEEERIWKYCIGGTTNFWKMIRDTSIQNLNSLRSSIESHLLCESIENIVSESVSQMLPIDIARGEIDANSLQSRGQARLVSPIEEWIRVQKESSVSALQEMTVFSLTNISLCDSSNWAFWEHQKGQTEKFPSSLTPQDFNFSSAVPRSRWEANQDVTTICSEFSHLGKITEMVPTISSRKGESSELEEET